MTNLSRQPFNLQLAFSYHVITPFTAHANIDAAQTHFPVQNDEICCNIEQLYLLFTDFIRTANKVDNDRLRWFHGFLDRNRRKDIYYSFA